MNHLREAAQQALESLEKYATHGPLPGRCPVREAEYALKAALEQPEQEPVAPYAWMAVGGTIWRRKTSEDDVPLYTAPPRREWQSLTDDEIVDIFEAEPRYHYPPIGATDREFARAIEQALKEKNQ